MEHRKIRRPQSDNADSVQPKRRQSVMPTGTRKPEIIQPTKSNQEITETPVPTAEHHKGKRRRRPKFEDRFTRVTTYVRKDLHAELRRRYDNMEVESITSVLNEALEAYFKSHPSTS